MRRALTEVERTVQKPSQALTQRKTVHKTTSFRACGKPPTPPPPPKRKKETVLLHTAGELIGSGTGGRVAFADLGPMRRW